VPVPSAPSVRPSGLEPVLGHASQLVCRPWLGAARIAAKVATNSPRSGPVDAA